MSHSTLFYGSTRRVARACAVLLTVVSGATTALAEPAAPAPEVREVTQEAKAPDVDKARAHFLQGVQFYNNGDYKLSLIEFRRSYELSRNYRILYNIGQVNQQLGNYTKALNALAQYLSDGGAEIPDDRRAEVMTNVAVLQRRVAHVRLLSNVSAPELLVDGFPVELSSDATITVDPGDHRIDVRKPGYQSAGTVVSLAAGDRSDIRLDLQKVQSQVVLAAPRFAPAPSERPSTWLWVGWGTTGAAALGAGITGVLASMQANELAELRNSPSSTQEQRDDVGRRARSFAIASDVLTATAVVAGGASLYLTLRGSKAEAPDRAPAPTTRVSFAPSGVSLHQTF